jgi:hypothetical protein
MAGLTREHTRMIRLPGAPGRFGRSHSVDVSGGQDDTHCAVRLVLFPTETTGPRSGVVDAALLFHLFVRRAAVCGQDDKE